MPIIHNESFDESDPFQLRRHGFYDMAGRPEVVVEEGEHTHAPYPEHFHSPPPGHFHEPEPDPAPAPSLDYFKAYWTPSRIRAARMAEHRRDG